MSAMLTGQLDLFGSHPDCCTGQAVPPVDLGDGILRTQARCGRCGQLVPADDLMIRHDRGWSGCPADRWQPGMWPDPQHRPNTRADLNTGRHDSLHHAPCGRQGCGDAWGLHYPHAGAARTPESASCWGCHDCHGYLAPTAGAAA